jgi:hypothetical protein
MEFSRDRRDVRPPSLARSNSDALLLRKRQDINYLDGPITQSARERKAMADANETAQQQLQYQQQQLQYQQQRMYSTTSSRPPPEPRHRAGTHVLARHFGGNDQSSVGPFRLNRKEKLFLIKRAKESAVALIDHAHTLDGPIQWHYKGKHRGIQMYRGEGIVDSTPSGSTTEMLPGGPEAASLEYLCGVTTMMGTLEEVSEYFDQPTSASMKVKKAEDVLDCAVLYSLVWGNTVNPFHRVSVKYHAYDGPAAMTRPRDFCYLECQDTFRHASGRRGWVQSMHSIKIPSCPEVPGFVRGSVYHSGFVFVEAERPGYMDVMYSLQINFKGQSRLPTFMLNAALKRRLRELIHISREIQVARMAHRTLLQDKDLMPKHLRSTCVTCSRRFWLFLRKTRCRMCGEVVCQSCAPLVDFDGNDHGAHHAKTRICVKCYTTAPSSGSWSAPSTELPWTEQSHYKHNSSVPYMVSPQRGGSGGKSGKNTKSGMRRVKEDRREDDEEQGDGGDGDDEGRYTFAELEEQSSHSVFAPERFTRSSMASIAPLQIDEIGVDFGDGDEDEDDGDGNDHGDGMSVRSSDNYWARGTEESVFNIGSVNSSIISRDSYFGHPPEPVMPPMVSAAGNAIAAARYSSRRGPLSSVSDDTPILMEEPDENQVSHLNATRASKKHHPIQDTMPPARAPSKDDEHDAKSPMSSKASSSFEFLDGLLDMPLPKNRPYAANDPALRRRAQTTLQSSSNSVANSELNSSTLRAHNLRYLRGFEHETPASSHMTFANRTPTPEDKSHLVRNSNEPVVLDDLLAASQSTTTSALNSSQANSVSTNSLFSRPSSLILQQVRKNRSRTIQLQSQSEEGFRTTNDIEEKAEDHRRRMEELNEKALAYTGNRVSTLAPATRPSLAPDKADDDVWRSSTRMEEYRNRRKLTIEALRKKALSIQDDNRFSSGTDRTVASSPSFSGPLSEVRTRGIYGRSSSAASGASAASAASGTGMVPFQSPQLVARKTSDASTSSDSPQFGRKQLLMSGKLSESAMRWTGTSEDLSFKPSLDEGVPQKLAVPEEADEESSLSSSLSRSKQSAARRSDQEEPEREMEAANDVSKTIPAHSKSTPPLPPPRRPMTLDIRDSDNAHVPPPLPPARRVQHEFVTPRSLYAEIGLLTQLHSEAATGERESEVDRIKGRIQEQYQLIRTLQLK